MLFLDDSTAPKNSEHSRNEYHEANYYDSFSPGSKLLIKMYIASIFIFTKQICKYILKKSLLIFYFILINIWNIFTNF